MASSFKDVTNKDVTARCRKPKHTKEENSKSKKDRKGYFYDTMPKTVNLTYTAILRGCRKKRARDNPERKYGI